jgi:hypothetical protein
VIEKGLLVEFGTHEELMALQGRYHYLYGLQTDALADDVAVEKTNEDGVEGEKQESVSEKAEDSFVKVQQQHDDTPHLVNGYEHTSIDGIDGKIPPIA